MRVVGVLRSVEHYHLMHLEKWISLRIEQLGNLQSFDSPLDSERLSALFGLFWTPETFTCQRNTTFDC
jgi:hypothetical protein